MELTYPDTAPIGCNSYGFPGDSPPISIIRSGSVLDRQPDSMLAIIRDPRVI